MEHLRGLKFQPRLIRGVFQAQLPCPANFRDAYHQELIVRCLAFEKS
jgi:hypothetical protein